ncbi:hypothetical protein ABG768_007980, partial [Culter alburnus]
MYAPGSSELSPRWWGPASDLTTAEPCTTERFGSSALGLDTLIEEQLNVFRDK